MIVVTGGAGFIGTHLVDALLAKGNEVTVIDNFSNSKRENVSREAKVIKGDVRDKDDVKVIRRCDFIFHLAAISDLRNANEDAMYQTNFIGSKNVFEAAQRAGAKVIFTSSAAVYGEKKVAKEDDRCEPISMYGKSKLAAERLLHDSAFIARLFNVYGPGGKGAINKFCSLVPKYEDITVYGTGMQTRDYIYVSDVVDALLLGMTHEGVYNVGTGREASLLEVIDVIHAATKAKPNIRFAQPDSKDIKRSRGDIAKITALGWAPRTDLQSGIEKTLRAEGVDLEAIKRMS